VTLYSGDMGNTFSLWGRKPCLGRSVTRWTNVSDSWLVGSTVEAVLCREFDISRKTGHKIFNRYKGWKAYATE